MAAPRTRSRPHAGRAVRPIASRRAAERGQATVEFVALLPVLALAAVAVGQGAVAGYAAWSAAGAARVGARVQALGGQPQHAVVRALPAMLGRGAKVVVASSTGDAPGRVTVRLRIPSVVPGLRFGTVLGRAAMPDQAGA